MAFESKPASRTAVKPLIGIYSESGGGKSMSALLLARGLVGPTGNIQQIDTEAGRGELYSDVIPGGYSTIRMTEPFSPDRYIEAVRFAEEQKADVIVIDQISNEWEGIAGVLDQAMQNEEAGKKGLSVWKAPKMLHAKMMVRLLQSPCPIITCLRAKFKSRQVKQNGKTEIVKDEMLTAIQDESFIYEMTVHGYVTQDHAFHPTKISHPALGACFPNGQPITIAHGEALARWCAAPGTSPVKPNGRPTDDDRKALITELWSVAKQVRGSEKGWNHFQKWAIDHTVIGEGDPPILEMTPDQLRFVIDSTKKVLA